MTLRRVPAPAAVPEELTAYGGILENNCGSGGAGGAARLVRTVRVAVRR